MLLLGKSDFVRGSPFAHSQETNFRSAMPLN
jgi:hypothetical protein